MVFGDGIQRQGNQYGPHDRSEKSNRRKCNQGNAGGAKQCRCETKQRADGKSDQHLAAVEKLEQAHSDEASGRQHSPKPGDRGRSGGVRVIAVILIEKFGNPVGCALLTSHVGKDTEEEHPDHRLAQKAAVHLERTGCLFACAFDARKAREPEHDNHQDREDGKDPVHRGPRKSRRSEPAESLAAADCLSQKACPGSPRDRSKFAGWRTRRSRRSIEQMRELNAKCSSPPATRSSGLMAT